MLPDTALGLCRFLVYAAAMVCWGANIYLVACVPHRLASRVDTQLVVVNRTLAIIALLATLALLPIRTAAIGEGWPAALSADLLSDVLFKTGIGTAWQVQTLAALGLVLARLTGRYRMGTTAIAGGLLLASLTITGHAAMNDGWLRSLHRGNDALHLLSGGAWLGALLPVFLILPRLAGDRGADAHQALLRFSAAGHCAVALVLVSGLLNILLVLGTLPFDWTARYQQLLNLKIALVAGLSVLALANRYVLVPRLRDDRQRTIRALRIATLVEILAFVVVLGLVAVLGMLDPSS